MITPIPIPPQTRLYQALKTGCPELLKDALDDGADPNDKTGRFSPLILATLSRSPSCMAILIHAGADIDAQDAYGGNTALMHARFRGQTSEVAMLLQYGANTYLKDNAGRDLTDLSYVNVFVGSRACRDLVITHRLMLKEKKEILEACLSDGLEAKQQQQPRSKRL